LLPTFSGSLHANFHQRNQPETGENNNLQEINMVTGEKQRSAQSGVKAKAIGTSSLKHLKGIFHFQFRRNAP